MGTWNARNFNSVCFRFFCTQYRFRCDIATRATLTIFGVFWLFCDRSRRICRTTMAKKLSASDKSDFPMPKLYIGSGVCVRGMKSFCASCVSVCVRADSVGFWSVYRRFSRRPKRKTCTKVGSTSSNASRSRGQKKESRAETAKYVEHTPRHETWEWDRSVAVPTKTMNKMERNGDDDRGAEETERRKKNMATRTTKHTHENVIRRIEEGKTMFGRYTRRQRANDAVSLRISNWMAMNSLLAHFHTFIAIINESRETGSSAHIASIWTVFDARNIRVLSRNFMQNKMVSRVQHSPCPKIEFDD